jgi:hypothetical protein
LPSRLATARHPCAHFLHLGKTGGTVVKAALAPVAAAGPYNLFLHPHHVTLSDVPPGDKFFFAVRDPIDRFVSGFYGRKRRDRPRYDIRWTRGERIAFSRFATPGELAEALSSIDGRRRTRAERAMREISHVKDSYWKWFGDERSLLARQNDLLMILFQSDLEADFDRLVRSLGLGGHIVLATDHVSAHRTPVTADRSLSAVATRSLERWYARDYEFLALCRDLRRRLMTTS